MLSDHVLYCSSLSCYYIGKMKCWEESFSLTVCVISRNFFICYIFPERKFIFVENKQCDIRSRIKIRC